MTQSQNNSEPTSQSDAMESQIKLSSSLSPNLSPKGAAPNRKLPAWLLSLCLHTVLGVGLLLVLSQQPSSGAADEENRSGGIVLVSQDSDTTEYLDEGDVEEANQSDASNDPPPAAIQSDPAPDLMGMESTNTEFSGAGESLLDALPGAESLIKGVDSNRIGEIGGKVTTEVFGIQGTGSRFVYVFDRSKSMNDHQRRPMLAARAALIESLNSLSDKNQFQIIFYNNFTTVFKKDGLAKLFFASDENKEAAERFINRTIPDGGTDHINALLEAFQMGPDVIFFLTDAEGGFTRGDLERLSKNNRGTVINAVEFGERQGRDRSLQQVAESTGGSYVFKNIASLRIKDN